MKTNYFTKQKKTHTHTLLLRILYRRLGHIETTFVKMNMMIDIAKTARAASRAQTGTK